MKILNELIWRELISNSTGRHLLTKDLSREKSISIYAGFDPTSPSLHIGHLIPLLMLRRFQKLGHRPVILIGGATGMIGDPRNSGERTLNTVETVSNWTDLMCKQIENFIEFSNIRNSAVVENNLSWVASNSTVDFLREIGKYFSVNTMLDRDVVKRRLRTSGISYTEFSYLILQANDFLKLHRKYNCIVQIGGSDQWGNIIAGIKLVKQITKSNVHGITTPLITNSQGEKVSKSKGKNNIWLNPEMTDPFNFYQYLINIDDINVIKYLKWFTFLSYEDIANLSFFTNKNSHKRIAQKKLAYELTTLVHGKNAAKLAENVSQSLFGQGNLNHLSEMTLNNTLPKIGNKKILEICSINSKSIVDIIIFSGLASSKSNARRLILEGGIYVNNIRVKDGTWIPQSLDFLHKRWLILRRGKNNIAIVKII